MFGERRRRDRADRQSVRDDRRDGQLIAFRSTTNTRGAFGGMSGGAPSLP
jgi:hypothetical protein